MAQAPLLSRNFHSKKQLVEIATEEQKYQRLLLLSFEYK
jgi:hypothetical protein